MNKPLFTVFVIAYYPPKYLTIVVESIMNQTYDNLEIILVNHAAHTDTVDYINKVRDADHRIKIINYEYNLITASPPESGIIVWNKVLSVSKGKYILHISDDNVLSNNYIEKMVGLFENNKECTTAAGQVVTIDCNGEIETKKIENGVRTSNYRPIYMPGHLLALDRLRKGRSRMFSSPGGGSIFAIKKSALVDAGGYHKGVERGIDFGIVPFGITGFDEDAVFYWRHHSRQLNQELLETGCVGSKENLDLIEDCNIYGKWKVFGDSVANYVVKELVRIEYKNAAWWLVKQLYRFRIKSAFSLFSAVGFKPYFIFIAIPFFMVIQLKKIKNIWIFK